MKYWLMSLGISLTIIFGGGFLIRLFRDGDFYIAEFTGGIIGINLLLIRLFITKKNSKTDDVLFK
ncbi:hypothetical protein [Oceanobacillus chungangensis]|uniref:Uncharacterized protein n=1 Tax=Oceanobacillus chungangensis TaxID=1229152 RepID=A0A3D8PP53_9BACI|nr:hypothetical protein [Oceanobacillus chungangensis]RDW17432.1 hypothetical protein CWR45_11985 [Oceanobacillus chungangensis]